MTHTYHIHGMTCNACRNHVEETLSKVEGVAKVMVDLEKAERLVKPIMTNNELLVNERQADLGNFMVGRLLPFCKKRQVGQI